MCPGIARDAPDLNMRYKCDLCTHSLAPRALSGVTVTPARYEEVSRTTCLTYLLTPFHMKLYNIQLMNWRFFFLFLTGRVFRFHFLLSKVCGRSIPRLFGMLTHSSRACSSLHPFKFLLTLPDPLQVNLCPPIPFYLLVNPSSLEYDEVDILQLYRQLLLLLID